VTGHQGYLGSVLVPHLLEYGHTVFGVDVGLFSDCVIGPAPVEIPTLSIDLRDVTADDLTHLRADAVIHLAGLSNDPLGNLDEALTRSINHEGTMRLARAAKAAGVERFLFASSCSLYGAGDDSLLVETSPLRPITAYAESKKLSEQGLSELADDDFSPTALRKATAYGFSPRLRCDLAVNDLVGRAALTGTVLLLSDGLAMRPFAHVEDIAAAYAAVLVAPRGKVHAATYNVGRTGENYRIRDLAELVAQAVPGSVVEYSPSVDADARNYQVSCDLLAAELPDLQLGWTVPRGIEQLVQAYHEHGLDLHDFHGERLRRLGRIIGLRQRERLDPTLRWRG
jgi:nucleoside-diphosphate-sugar epimerase